MVIKTRYCIKTEYLTLDAETLNRLEMGECSVEEAIVHATSKSFNEISTLVARFGDQIAQYTVAGCNNLAIAKMDAFGTSTRQCGYKFEDVYVYHDAEDLRRIASIAKDFGFHEACLFDTKRNDGRQFHVADKFGACGNGKAIIGYLMKESWNYRSSIAPILVSKDRYQDFLRDIAYLDNRFAVFKSYCMDR